ncbi:hypothetical protein [Salinibacterium sp. ZJ77]|uniref:hypothetical protein n=1 Tax=Salinibacterium sp. ZJ77 TaxID=2708337 RepID=UPI00141E4799|nr:hypothetical protein [Salinibacterium sp. ZJ77]
MTFLQKAIMPGRERAWLAAGDDLLCGYVVDAADAAWASTAAQLVEVHGLSFPGSPYTADPDFVDVIRFPASSATPVIPALGEVAGVQGGPFRDHPPFNPAGFAPAEQTVPVWWLDPIRVPAGSEIWRVHRDGHEELVAAYPHVAAGWKPAADFQVPRESDLRPSHVLGVFGTWKGERVIVDLLPDGQAVIASLSEIEGLHLIERGFWATVVDAAEVEDLGLLRLVGNWNGLLVQVVRSIDAETVRVVFVGRDAFAAEAGGMQKTDAGVYEATIPQSDLADLAGAATAVTAPGPTPSGPSAPGSPADREAMIARGREVFARFTDTTEFTIVDLPDGLGVALVHAVRGGGKFFVAPDLTVLYSASSQSFDVGLDAFRSGRRTAPEKLRGT